MAVVKVKSDPYSIKAIRNVKNRRKRYISAIGDDELQIEKHNTLDSKEEDDKAFRDKYSNKRW